MKTDALENLLEFSLHLIHYAWCLAKKAKHASSQKLLLQRGTPNNQDEVMEGGSMITQWGT